ncbi:MAG: hypothetical protein JNL34_13425 [Anaerolineae bacterium]|nr:hypothetical protein [Anaerolineae bacterium]
MNRGVEKFRGLSRGAQVVAGLILAGLILALLAAFFASEIGRAVTLVCCGGVIIVVVIGLLSERGMRRK